jgi:kumamolisin
VAPEELHERFGVPQASVAALEDWLRSQDFEVEHVTKDGTSIYASAPLSVIEKSLGVDMVDVTKGGYRYAAARQAPSLPAEVAGDVTAIIGLQPYRQARKHLRRAPLVPDNADTANDTPASRTNGYLVEDILGAYGAANVQATGSEQTIAILIDTFPLQCDLQAFWAANNLPDDLARIDMINVPNGPLPEISGEESLDLQWSSGIAPDAKVRLYASGELTFVALDRALDAIIADLPAQPSLRQLSISLGLGEIYFESAKGEIATQHQKFLRLAAAGVNVFVSSGDAGSNPDQTGHSSTGPTKVEYEASDPCVVAVGGTSLHLNADGSVAEETAWAGSGGGKSTVFGRPHLADRTIGPSRQPARRARRGPRRRPGHRRDGRHQRQRNSGRRHKLGGSRLGRTVRPDKRCSQQSRQTAARLPQPAPIPTRRNHSIPRRNIRQQQRLQRHHRIRHGHRPRNTKPSRTHQRTILTDPYTN